MWGNIPFNKQAIVGDEENYVRLAIASKEWGGGGSFCRSVEAFIQSRFETPKAIVTASCTTALDVAAILCRLEPGDEVIMPSFTFTSTANAFLLRGAKPVFVDIRPDTQNIDERLIEDAITDRTRAICVVHYAGVSCEMDAIMEIASRRGLIVVEDAAQGVFAKYKDKWLGAIGDIGGYSFTLQKTSPAEKAAPCWLTTRRMSRALRSCATRAPTGANFSAARRANMTGATSEFRALPLTAPPPHS